MPQVFISTATRDEGRRRAVAAIRKAAAQVGVDPLLMLAIGEQESDLWPWAVRFEPGLPKQDWFVRAIERTGGTGDAELDTTSVGPLQILTVNCYADGYDGSWFELFGNVDWGCFFSCRHMKRLLDRYDGDVEKAVSAYNWGSASERNRTSYVEPVMANLARWEGDDESDVA